MSAFNSYEITIIMGNLVADPELRFTQAGDAVASFKVAVNRRFKKAGDDTYTEEAEFYRCTAWRNLGEFVNKFSTKGKPIQVIGKMRTRSWEDRETGVTKYSTELLADEIVIIGSGQRASAEDVAPAQDRAPAKASGRPASKPAATRAPARNVPQTIDSDEDLPF